MGAMAFAASALLIPASIYFGSLPDRNRASKPYILISFLAASVILYAMTMTTSILLFQILYIALEFASYIRGPSTSVLIAETFEKKKRGAVIARGGSSSSREWVWSWGWVICTLFVNTVGYANLLLVACPLTLASFLIALFTLRDSPLYIERSLDRFEGMVDRMEDFSVHLAGDRSVAGPTWAVTGGSAASRI